MTDLTGRQAIVTGSARGLGKAVVGELAGCGARVAVADVDGDGAHAVAEELTAATEALAVVADCATSAGIATVLDRVEDVWGAPADLLVNNAGVLSNGPLLEVADDEIERVFRINAAGPMIATREFAARLVSARTGGSVVNITSSTAHVASLPGLTTYASSKGALLAFTRNAATDLARHDIRVNAVAPGWMRTDMSAELDEGDGQLLRRIPMRRPAHVSEVAKAVAFLLSDDAGYVTGSSLPVDGGWLGY